MKPVGRLLDVSGRADAYGAPVVAVVILRSSSAVRPSMRRFWSTASQGRMKGSATGNKEEKGLSMRQIGVRRIRAKSNRLCRGGGRGRRTGGDETRREKLRCKKKRNEPAAAGREYETVTLALRAWVRRMGDGKGKHAGKEPLICSRHENKPMAEGQERWQVVQRGQTRQGRSHACLAIRSGKSEKGGRAKTNTRLRRPFANSILRNETRPDPRRRANNQVPWLRLAAVDFVTRP